MAIFQVFTVILGSNPNITWEIVQNNPQIPWNHNYLSQNPNITWEIIQNNPQIRWNYGRLSEHPNITWEGISSVKLENIVDKNPQIPCVYTVLSINTMEKGKEQFIQSHFKQQTNNGINTRN